jgi:hypothetical protein
MTLSITRTRDLPACSIVPQPTTLPRAPFTYAWTYQLRSSYGNFRPNFIYTFHFTQYDLYVLRISFCFKLITITVIICWRVKNNPQDCWVFGLCPSSGILKGTKNQCKRLTLSTGCNRAGVSHSLTWGRKQIQFPKHCVLLRLLESLTMDEVQKPNNPKCYTPSSEPLRIYLQKKIFSSLLILPYLHSCARGLFIPAHIWEQGVTVPHRLHFGMLCPEDSTSPVWDLVSNNGSFVRINRLELTVTAPPHLGSRLRRRTALSLQFLHAYLMAHS